MRLALRLALVVVVLLGAAYLVFTWYEAEQEVRILCSMFHEGLERESVLQTLATGAYLRYRTENGVEDSPILVDSLYNLGWSRCVVELEAGRVVSAVYE